MDWRCVGSGFLAAPGRLVTAAHVIETRDAPDPFFIHQDSDRYYFLHRDDDDNYWFYTTGFEKGKTLFLEAENDVAVFYLPDAFYGENGQQLGDRNKYLTIASDYRPIGYEIGVLGYPIANLQFQDRDLMKPQIGDVILRVDRGVINARYHTADGVNYYDFTMAFNPGNSGGPIFDGRTGKVISIVHGFKLIDIRAEEKELPAGLKTTEYSLKAFIDNTKATYSVGVASPSFHEFLTRHGVK